MSRNSLKIVLFILAVFISLVANSQELQVRSFRLAANDISAVKYQRLDLNGRPCALIKVGLGVKGAKFPGSEVFGDVKYDTGEYWVYVVDGTKRLKVMHEDYAPLYIDFGNYPEQRLEGGGTYVLILAGSKSDVNNNPTSQQAQGNFLIMNVTPTSSQVSIDNGISTATDSDGSFKVYLDNGSHSYRVEAGNAYSPVTGTIEMKGERITLPVTLKSVKATLAVNTTTSGSKIYVNEDYKGTDQWQGELSPGTYLVEARKDGCRSASTTVTLAKQQTETVTLPALQQLFGSLMVDYEPVDADVYLDNRLLGKSPNVFTNIQTGKHSIKISKAGYADYSGSVTIEENRQASVRGSLSKSSSISGTVVPITVNGVTFNMIRVDGGTFTMGATSEMTNPLDGEKPTHQVTLSSYYIGETEVTQSLWQAVMGSNPSKFKGDNLPVEQVSWSDCQDFIKKLNEMTGKSFRLPTEAEWEFAARGGNKSRHTQYSGSSNIDEVAWYWQNSGDKYLTGDWDMDKIEKNNCRTHPVKTKKSNELGIYDMSGNVWEWCQDYYGSYSSTSQTNPTGPDSGTYRVVRGGSWSSVAGYCRSSNRSCRTPGSSHDYLGLRLVLSE